MKHNFDACMDFVFQWEGGYVNHPADPGGETKYGISKRSYPTEDIKNMTHARAAEIYRRDYWTPVGGDELPMGLDLIAFDAAVNSGVSRGARWLQKALGVAQDGMVGPQTIMAARGADRDAVIRSATEARLLFLKSISGWPTFGNGWTRRVKAVRMTALSMKPAEPVEHVSSWRRHLERLVDMFR